MRTTTDPARFETIVIGGGQAGLSVGYHLAKLALPFVILEERDKVGDSWRDRWDSLRLFTPARFDGLDGMPFPAHAHHFPTKNEMADYLSAYANRFELPVLTGTRVDRLSRANGRFVVYSGERRFEADNVVVAMANFQKPWVPPFAAQIDPDIVQLHSAEYRSPEDLIPGPVLVAGAGNSGAELALELAARHDVILAGRDPGQIPFRVEGTAARLGLFAIILRVLFHRILTVRTPLGRKVRPKVTAVGGPRVRVKAIDLKAAGVQRAPRITGVEAGRPLLEDGRALDVSNIIWSTGYRPGFDWIDLPCVTNDEPDHRSGVVESMPGLYFVGLHFLHAMSSVMIHGVGRDAQRIAAQIAASRTREPRSTRSAATAPSAA